MHGDDTAPGVAVTKREDEMKTTDEQFASLLAKINASRVARRSNSAASVEDFTGEIVAIHALADGNKLLAIQLTDEFVLARVDAALQLDPGFGGGTGFIADVFSHELFGFSAAYGIAVGNDGIFLEGEFFDFLEYQSMAALAKYTFDGDVDSSFGQDGKLVLQALPGRTTTGPCRHVRRAARQVASQVVLDDGKLVLLLLEATWENSDGTTQLIRLNADGSFDTTFNHTGVAHVSIGGLEINPGGLHLLEGNKLLVYGGTQPVEGSAYALVARYTDDGQLDETFNAESSPGFIAIGEPLHRARFGALLVDETEDVFAVGNLDGDVLMAHCRKDGRPAPEFNDGQPLRFALEEIALERLYAVQWQKDELVVAGTAIVARERRGVLLRLSRQGELDAGFGNGQGYAVANLESEYFDVLVEPEGDILTGGYFTDSSDHAWLKNHGPDGNAAQLSGSGNKHIHEYLVTRYPRQKQAL